MGVRADVAKSELEHGHTRNLQEFAEGVHIGRDVAKIFGEKWQPAQSLAKLHE